MRRTRWALTCLVPLPPTAPADLQTPLILQTCRNRTSSPSKMSTEESEAWRPPFALWERRR